MVCFENLSGVVVDMAPVAMPAVVTTVASVVEPRVVIEPIRKEANGGLELVMDGAKAIARGIGQMFKNIPTPSIWTERTGFEKKIILAAGAYGLWKLCRDERVGRLAREIVVPGYRYAKCKFGKVDIVMDPVSYSQRSVLESRRDGSEEVLMTVPKYQCRIGVMRDGQFVVLGAAVRFDHNMLIAPDHVIGGDSVEEKFAYGSQAMLSLRGYERIPLDTDLVCLRLSDKDMAKIGISVCRIVAIPSIGAFASIIGPVSKGTTGIIRNDPQVFGRVIYSGTTLSGYSGSAYNVGSAIVGLHQMGGQVNGGYSASYVWCLLKAYLKIELESDKWLEGEFKAGKKIKWSFAGDPDYVNVEIDGAYSLVKTDTMYTTFGREWSNNRTIERKMGQKTYGDYESGESLSSESPGVLSSSEEAQDVTQPLLQSLMKEYEMLSKKQQKTFQKSLGIFRYPTPTTAGQAKTEQQQN